MKTNHPYNDGSLGLPQEEVATPEGRHNIYTAQELVNVFTLAKRFNVHYRTAQRWTKNKWIPHYRVGKSIRYSLSEVFQAVSSNVG